ncbi:SPOSA6832_00388 [Sporobolomyces salmonicolor]|uniref:SPOSA6832_00388-mRNA-1:cds n=1 Tax=Sporidiobolus salmonicolor TaxID=5005 RepID=A0A0D6EH45_SPOSA|nr:SPOSA6832_00388 [Sporobolomyces salmonicolor]
MEDDLRLPTPPPEAPFYPLPKQIKQRQFASIEYPAPVHSVDAALATVGGLRTVAAALSSTPTKPIELNLAPDNPFFHPPPAHVANTNNLVFKLTKRRRKVPKLDEQGNIVEEGIFTLEPVGIEKKTVRFRSMADFQFTPNVTQGDPTLKLVDAIRNMDIAGIRSFTMPPPNEDFTEASFIPPPVFTRHGLPQNFDMRPAGGTVRVTTESGATRLVNSTRYKTRTMQSVMFIQERVPAEPEATFLKELGRSEPNEIEARMLELLQERPVWTRLALNNQLTPEELKYVNNNKSVWPMIGYTFSDGPFRDLVVRFGYDPRKDREARFYQHIVLRNAANVRHKALPGTRSLAQSNAAAARAKGPKASSLVNLSHEFDGKTVYSKVGHFQLCDIHDPLTRRLIDAETGVLAACSSDPNEGWYAYDYLDQIRQVVRRKFTGLLNGLQVDDDDCADLLGWEMSTESRQGQGHGRQRRGSPKVVVGRGKGRARRGSGSRSDTSASGASSSGRSGSGGSGSDGEGDGDGDDDENGSRAGSELEGTPSGSGATRTGRALSQASDHRGKKQKPAKPVKAPWEAPKRKKGRPKQAETEADMVRIPPFFGSLFRARPCPY